MLLSHITSRLCIGLALRDTGEV